jgi:tetratricopeptide (TPR) repeat protein
MRVKPIYILILMIFMTSILSSMLYNSLLKGRDNYTSDSLNAVFGSTRTALSLYFYDKADLYFHRGITEGVEAHRGDEKAISSHKDHDHHDHHEDMDMNHKDHDHNEDIEMAHKSSEFEPKNPVSDFYTKMAAATIPSGHFHRSGRESKEILPWIYLAIKIDPSNDELYRTISYWLDKGVGRRELSSHILDIAQQNIPYSPSIKLEQGLICLKENNQKAALQKFQAALRFMDLQPEKEQDSYLKANILLELAGIYERQGETAKALEKYKQIHQLFPKRQLTIYKINQLKKTAND